MTHGWDILFQVFGKQSCWTHVKPTQKTKNGRMAYQSLKKLLIGDRFMLSQARQIETDIAGYVYKGQSSGWTLLKYITKFKEQWVLADSLLPHGFRGFDECIKVQKLIQGIKTDELNVGMQYITGTPELANNFNLAADHLLDFHMTIVQRDSSKSDRNIHAVYSANGRSRSTNNQHDFNNSHRGSDRSESALRAHDPDFEPAVDKRYTEYDRIHFGHGSQPRAIVPKNEYSNFNRVQKAAIYHHLREHYKTSTKPYSTSQSGRGGSCQVNASVVESDVSTMRNTMTNLAKSMKEMKRSISQMTRKDDADDHDSDNSLFSHDDAKKPKGNKGNVAVALKREGGSKPLGRQK